jgi:hypothetical protein
VIRTIMERFVEQSPMAVMARLVMQCGLHAEWLEDSFEPDGKQDSEQTREQLFSMIVEAMAAIAAPAHQWAGGAAEGFGVPVTMLHDRVSRLREGWSRQIVKDSAALLAPVARPRAEQRQAMVAGYRLGVLDARRMSADMKGSPGLQGYLENVAALDAVRTATSGRGVLPVYDPDLRMIVDLLPYEHGHERAFVGALSDALEPGDLWIIDGGFNTSAILSGWPRGGSAFIVQEHDRPSVYRDLGPLHEAGQRDDGPVYEQAVTIVDGCGAAFVFRRIEWHRSDIVDDANAIVRILTNVPASHLDASQIVQLSCRRWSDALPLSTDAVLDCANVAGVSQRAALLACSIAAVAYNILSMMLDVVGDTHDLDSHDLEGLPFHIAAGVEAAYAGMMIALPSRNWQRYDQLPAAELAEIVRRLAVHIDPRSERRRRQDKMVSAKSQARLLAGTVECLLHGDTELDTMDPFRLRTITMATRDFSSNPSKALRHVGDALVMVTKYNRPIALLVSIDNWNRLLGEVRETSLDRLSLDYAAFAQMIGPAALSEPSFN